MFFVIVLVVTGVLFAIVTPFYRGKIYLQDQAEGALAAQPEA